MGTHQRRAVRAALATLAVCGGCWKEIHYTPPAETPDAAENAHRETPPPDAVVLDTPAAPPAGAPIVLEEPAAAPAPREAPVTLP